MSGTPSRWNRMQQMYWSAMAQSYDSLYETRWSRLENDWVQKRIASQIESHNARVVDLGCGTGLGAEMLGHHIDLAGYVGVDIAAPMAAIANRLHNVATHVGPMDELGWIDNDSIDVVISTFSAASFCEAPERLLHEVHRILKPQGYAYISFLGRPRPLGDLARTFRTRGARHTETSTVARRYRPSELRRLAMATGFRNPSITAMNAFSGVCEAEALWNLGVVIGALLPRSSHLLELEVTK